MSPLEGLAYGFSVALTPGNLLAALLIQGVQPGPLLMQQRPEVFWGVVASMYVGNVALLILNFPLVGIWVSVLRIPQSILVALILMFTLVGAYSINNSPLDLVVLVVMGVVGYVMKKLGFDLSPMVLGLVLGGMLEKMFQQSLYMSRGDVFVFVKRPVSGALLAVLAAIIVVPPAWRVLRRQTS